MHRFFISPELILNGKVNFPGDLSHQIARVLRMNHGEEIVVLDGMGNEYLARLIDVNPHSSQAEIFSKTEVDNEPLCHVYLYIGLTQREKFEWILQKSTEIGVGEFIPMITSRSLVQSRDHWKKRSERWAKIIREAAEQSGRTRLPTLHTPREFEEAVLHAVQNTSLVLVPWEKEGTVSLRKALEAYQRTASQEIEPIALLIGPEGGFSEDEVDMARRSGSQTVSLGTRILRMETAAILAAGLVLYELGEFG